MPTRIKSLGDTLDAMSEKVKALPTLPSANKPMVNFLMHPVNISSYPPLQETSSFLNTHSSPNSKKKVNVVLFSIKLSPKGIPQPSE